MFNPDVCPKCPDGGDLHTIEDLMSTGSETVFRQSECFNCGTIYNETFVMTSFVEVDEDGNETTEFFPTDEDGN